MLSFPENIPVVLKLVDDTKAHRILDIGAGMGKYGLLIREMHMSEQANLGRLKPKNFSMIDACEYTRYFLEQEHLSKIYDTVYPESFLTLFDKKEDSRLYELVLMIDVVEHYDKETVIEFLKTYVETPVLISTPKRTEMYTEHFYGDAAHHVSQWDMKDFKKVGPILEDRSNDLSWIVLVAPTA